MELFTWPHVFDIWQTYLVKFLARYGGRKLERARDLFEQCVAEIPKEYAKKIFLLYAKLEEEHGLVKRAMEIYSKSIDKVWAATGFLSHKTVSALGFLWEILSHVKISKSSF